MGPRSGLTRKDGMEIGLGLIVLGVSLLLVVFLVTAR